MLKSVQVGAIRIELAKILSKWCEVHVAPALLTRNYGPRNFGCAYSWTYDGEKDHPLCGAGSSVTMTDFIKYIKKGYLIVLRDGELYIVNKDYYERRNLKFPNNNPEGGCYG